MAFTFTEQFYLIDTVSPPPVGTTLNVTYLSVTDNNGDGHIAKGGGDLIDGSRITSLHTGDTVTVELADGTHVTYVGVTFYLEDGRAVFTPTDLQYLADAVSYISSTFSNSKGSTSLPDFGPPVCFTKGTLIATTKGQRPVETLEPGDKLITSDGDIVALILSHARSLDEDHLHQYPKHRPILLPRDSLGTGIPNRDLIVSPQHRILLRSAICQKMFGAREILVPACQLVGWKGIERLGPEGGVAYVHLLTKDHNVVIAEGAPSETLYLGTQAANELSDREILAIFRRLDIDQMPDMKPARLFVRGKRLRKLLERHASNARSLVAAKPDQTTLPLTA